MKTNNVSLTILAKEPERPQKQPDDIALIVRTPDGELMTNRVRSLLREYGARIQIPSALALEVLEDRNRKSRQLKTTERELGAYVDALGDAVGVLIELRNAANDLLEGMLSMVGDHTMSEMSIEVDAVSNALEVADDFLAEIIDDDDCDCDDCNYESDEA